MSWQAASPFPLFLIRKSPNLSHPFLHKQYFVTRSRIYERTIALRFQGIILRVLRLEVSVYNVYITNQFQTTFAEGEGGSKIC